MYTDDKTYINEKKYALALQNLKSAAESGHEPAMDTLIFDIYGKNSSGLADKNAYRHWVEELAKRGNPRAMVKLGGILCRVDAGTPNSFGKEAYFDESADYQKGLEMIETALKNSPRTKGNHEKLKPTCYLTVAMANYNAFTSLMEADTGEDALEAIFKNNDFTIAKKHLPFLEKAEKYFSRGVEGLKRESYSKESINSSEKRYEGIALLLNHIKNEGKPVLATEAELVNITKCIDEIDRILAPVEAAFFHSDSAFSLEKARDSIRTAATFDILLSRTRGDHSNKFGHKCYEYENEFLPGFHNIVKNCIVLLIACGTVTGQLPQNYANRMLDAFDRISKCDSHIVDLYNLVAELQKEHDNSMISDSQIAENKRFYEANKSSIKEMSDMLRKYM